MTQYELPYRKSHALLIGIDEYQQFSPLFTAVKGVCELASVLREQFSFQPENIIILENGQATQRAIQRSLLDPLSRSEKVGPDDRVIVYFAGHGATVDTAVGEVGYLIPVDADPEYEDTFIAMDDLTRMAAERFYARHVLFLLDACFSGFATTRMGEGVKRELGDLLRSPSRQVITAGMRDQVVSDSWGPGGHSLFTGFLIEGLRGTAPMPGGVLRTFHLAGYLQDQVAQHSRSRQTPQYASLMGSQGGDFVFAVREVNELPEWVSAAAASQETAQRLTAVSKLREMASDIAHPQMADQALAKLEELSKDRDALVRASVDAALKELMPQTEPAPHVREEPLIVQPVALAVREEPVAVLPPTPKLTTPTAKPTTAARKPHLESAQPRPVQKQPRNWVPFVIGGGIIAVALIIGGLVLSGALGGGTGKTPEPTQQVAGSVSATPTIRASVIPTNEPVDASRSISTPTLGEQARALAEAGVARNVDWTPYTEEINGVLMALVPAGCFMMGSENGESDERPVHEVCFDKPFWIDVIEVTNGQFAAFDGQAGSSSHWTDADRPRECITWTEADAFCRKRGARLPTEAEWEYVARGPDDLVYPWGNEFESDNVISSAPETSDAGSKPSGMSWAGAYDLSGNVLEWINDWYSKTYYGTLAGGEVNPQGPISGTYRVLRGGSWTSSESRYVRGAYRSSGDPDVEFRFVGFRCARSY